MRHKAEFVLASIGLTVRLGNEWRFSSFLHDDGH